MALKLVLLLCLVVLIAGDSYHPKHKHDKVLREQIRAGESDASFWNDMAQATLAEHLTWQPNTGLARNSIMFLGDGLSIPSLTAARILNGGEQSKLSWEDFPYVGLSKTYCVDAMVADSACSATAYLCGIKCNDGTIGVTAAVPYNDCASMLNTTNHVFSILRKAQLAGLATGIVTTTRITHASPAGAYAHTADRDWESDADISADGEDPVVCDDIAEMLIRGETGMNLNVILGGGRSNFRATSMVDEEGSRGRRLDGMDLIAEWQAGHTNAGHSWGWAFDLPSLQAININSTDYIFGLFETSHMNYNLDNDPLLKPTLPQLTQIAIQSLSRHPRGYVLFVEGGRIDHAHHATRAQYALDETIQFSEAVNVGRSMTSTADTLIVVTADHAHTMSINGYPVRGQNLLSIAGQGSDSLPYSTLSYGNGPGYKNPTPTGDRYDITNDNFNDPKYEYPAVAPLSSETHGGDDVAVFASGPWAHLYTGTYEQNFIEHVMSFAMCVSDGLNACVYKRHA